MGFWGWFIVLGLIGALFLRARITDWRYGLSDLQLKNFSMLSGTGFVAALLIYIIAAVSAAGEADTDVWIWALILALTAWGSLLALIENGRRNIRKAEQQQRELLKRSNSYKRLIIDQQNDAIPEQYEGSAPPAAKSWQQQVGRIAEAGKTVAQSDLVDLGSQLFGSQWRKLVEPGAKAAPPQPESTFDDDEEFPERPYTPEEGLPAITPDKLLPAAAPVAAHAAASPPPAAPHAVPHMTEPAPVPAMRPAIHVTTAPAQVRPAALSGPYAGKLASRPAGPVSLGLSSGPRPVGPVTLGGSTGRFSQPGPVKLKVSGDLAKMSGAAQATKPGEPLEGPRFHYQPSIAGSKLKAKQDAK